MNPLRTTTLEPQINAWHEVRHLLPADVNTAIEQRLALWQQAHVDRPAPVEARPVVLLVMRAGTIPRPIDPFFFEIINH